MREEPNKESSLGVSVPESQLSKAIKWATWNGALATALVSKALWDIPLLHWLIAGFIWFMAISYTAVLVVGSEKPHRPWVPRWLEVAVDLVLLALIIYLGWYITGGVYIASIVVLDAIYRRDRAPAD